MKIFSSRGIEIADILISENSREVYQLGSSDYLELHFSTEDAIRIGIGSYVDWNGKRYVLLAEYFPQRNVQHGGYDYVLRLDAWYMAFDNRVVKFSGNGKETSFTLTADLATHMGVIMRSLAEMGFSYDGKPYEASIVGVSNSSEAKLVSYEATSVIGAIKKLCSADLWDCEWWVEGNIFHLGKCESGRDYSEVALHDAWHDGEKPNIQSVKVTGNNNAVANRYYVFGSDKNLPDNYRKGEIGESSTTTGVVQRRLMLPEGIDYIDAYRYNGEKRVYLGEQGYETATEMPIGEVVESVKIIGEVYPRREEEISQVVTRTVYDEVTHADGTTTQTEAKIYQIRLASSTDSRKWFKSSYLLANGEPLKLNFTGASKNLETGEYASLGLLNGMVFDAIFNPDKVNEDDSNSQWFEIVRNEEYGRMLPDEVLKPMIGDRLVLTNWDISLMDNDGLGYIAEAEQELYNKAVEYIKQEYKDSNNYECTMMSDVMLGYDCETHQYNEDNALVLGLGQKVVLYNDNFLEGYRNSRIIGWNRKMDCPYDSPKYIVGIPVADGTIKKLQGEVENLTIKGQRYESTGGGGIYVIGSNDKTRPSNTNVFSALRTQRQFADKGKDEIIEGIWQFLNGMKSRNHTSGVLGKGWWLGSEESGNSYLEVDKLYVRMKAIFDTLEIKHVSHVGGEFMLSPAGAKIKAVEESVGGAIPFDAVEDIAINSFGSDATIEPQRIIYVMGLHRFVGEYRKSGVLTPTYYGVFKGSEEYNCIGMEYYNKSNGLYYRYLPSYISIITEYNAYKCYINTEDEEEKVVNTFKEGDLVMCKTFNLDAERQRYYWRKCVGVGEDYVELSKTQCDGTVDNDVPLPQDNIVTVGNSSDTDRQNAIVISSYGTFSPSIILYKGIDTFSLDNKAEIQISPRGNKFKGEFIVKTADGEEYSLVEFLNDRISLKVNAELYSEECVVEPNPNIQGETAEYTIDLNDNCLEWQQGDKIIVEIGLRCKNTGDVIATLYGEEATPNTISPFTWNQEFNDPSGNDIDTTITAELEVLAPVVRDSNYNYAYFLFGVNAEYDISSVSIKRKNLQEMLARTGIDIEEGIITLDAETTTIKNGDKEIAVFTTDDEGNAVIKAELIDAEQLSVAKLNTKPSNKPHISIEGEQVQIYDADNKVKVKLHGGKLSKASGTDEVSLICNSQSLTLNENQHYARIILNTTALVVKDTTMLYQMETINTVFSFIPNVASDNNPIPTYKNCRIQLLRYYTPNIDANFDIDTAEDYEVLGTFETGWENNNGKTFTPKFSVPNTTYPVGSYKFVLELSINTSVKSGLFKFNPSVEIVGSPILNLQEIAEDGFNFQYGNATKYVVSTADGFEVRHGSYGIRVSEQNGAVYTTDGFQTTMPFGTGGGGEATYPVITATATVNNASGTPNVNVTKSGGDSNPTFTFAFSGLKGETGAKGDKGDKGDSASIIIK